MIAKALSYYFFKVIVYQIKYYIHTILNLSAIEI